MCRSRLARQHAALGSDRTSLQSAPATIVSGWTIAIACRLLGLPDPLMGMTSIEDNRSLATDSSQMLRVDDQHVVS